MDGDKLDADDELLELRKEAWIDMTIFDDDNRPSVDRGTGLIYDFEDATDVGSMNTHAYMQRRKNKKTAVGLTAMMAESSMKRAALAGGNDFPSVISTWQSTCQTLINLSST